MEELLAKIPYFEALIGQQQAENIQLRAENAEIRAQLVQNSTNSTRLPAADGIQKKTIKPPLYNSVINQADNPAFPVRCFALWSNLI